MSVEERRVVEMVQAGTITEAEGRRLIDAMRDRPPAWRMLLNPFDHLSTPAGWLVGLIVLAASVGVSRLGIRFDGALDVHAASGAVPWARAAIDMVNDVGVTAIVFWVASLVAGRRGRIPDFVLGVLVARVPVVVVGAIVFALFPPPEEVLAQITSGAGPDVRVVLTSVLTIPLMLWFLAWLYRGFAHASGLRSVRSAVTFGAALIVAEILTKLVLMQIG